MACICIEQAVTSRSQRSAGRLRRRHASGVGSRDMPGKHYSWLDVALVQTCLNKVDFDFGERNVSYKSRTQASSLSAEKSGYRASLNTDGRRPNGHPGESAMSSGQEFRFKIDAFTPDTLPMARLAEYMADFAIMLGELTSVHFSRIEEGSATLVSTVDVNAVPRVRERFKSIRDGNGPKDAMQAFQKINFRLKDDNCSGILAEEDAAGVILFPGREMEIPVPYGPFSQEGSLDGKVIMVGGKADPVPVHIQQGEIIYNCHAKRDLASALGHHLFEAELRVRGVGRWTREPEGTWTLNRFNILSFQVLDDEPLSKVVAYLREVPGSGWNQVPDPWSELKRMREEDVEAN